MQASFVLRVIFAIFATRTFASSSLDAEGDCADGYLICSPPGATSATTPEIGTPDFQNLFVDIVQSSLPPSKRDLSGRGVSSLCCNELLSCLAMSTLALPFCYDRFTTNYFLPDGSHGTVVGGSYVSSAGDTANLETGDYTLVNGTTGNIYSSNPVAKPNTATLPLPSQFTASGVGSAIPVNSLGSQITLTYTTTLPASTLPAQTISPTTIAGAVVSETILLPMTISTQISNSIVLSVQAVTSLSPTTEPAKTIPGSTISGSSVAAVVTVVTTTTEVSGVSASATPGPSTSASGAKQKSAAVATGKIECTRYLILLLGVLLYIQV